MACKNDKFTILTKGFDDLIDITSKVQDIVSSYSVKAGIVNISVLSSTASIITLEDEPGLSFDLPNILENIVPINKVYQHDASWYDGNANAHLKAAILGNNLNLSVVDGKIELSTWQKIVLIDFDNKSANRQVVVSVVF